MEILWKLMVPACACLGFDGKDSCWEGKEIEQICICLWTCWHSVRNISIAACTVAAPLQRFSSLHWLILSCLSMLSSWEQSSPCGGFMWNTAPLVNRNSWACCRNCQGGGDAPSDLTALSSGVTAFSCIAGEGWGASVSMQVCIPVQHPSLAIK